MNFLIFACIDSHVGFGAIILCIVWSRRRSMGKNFGLFVLKMLKETVMRNYSQTL